MAIATLESPYASFELQDGETAFMVRTDVFGAEPYSGRAGTEFCRFDANAGTFEWKTLSDKLRELALAFVAGDVDEADALAGEVGHWLKSKLEYVAELEDVGELKSDSELVTYLLRGIADGSIDTTQADQSFSAYHFEDDAHFRDAAEALPLPEWGTVIFYGEGGPGSGYDQPYLVLGQNKTLADYQAWLEGQGAV